MNDSRLPSIVSTGIDEEMPWSAVARHRFGKERRYVNRDLPRRYRATALQGGAHYAIMGAGRFELRRLINELESIIVCTRFTQ